MNYYRQGPRGFGSGVTIGTPGLTPVVRGILIACTGIWVLQFGLQFAGIHLESWLGLIPAAVLRGWIWQLGTYMFLHQAGDPFHVLFNMLMLWMFGGELERYWGGRTFLRFYLGCGIGAGIVTTLFNAFVIPGIAWTATIGASGAIYGLFAAYGVIFADRVVFFMLLFPLRARTMALLMVAITFCYTLLQPDGGVSHIAHLGGALVGFLWVKRVWRPREFWRELRWSIRRRRFKLVPPRSSEDRDRWIH